jgi:hypothetical protein
MSILAAIRDISIEIPLFKSLVNPETTHSAAMSLLRWLLAKTAQSNGFISRD